MNLPHFSGEMERLESADGGLFNLSSLLEEAAREGHPDTCKAIAILMAARVTEGILPEFYHDKPPSYGAPERLRRRFDLPTIGSARVLAAFVDTPDSAMSIETIAAKAACSPTSAVCFLSQLRSHLRGLGFEDALVGSESTVINTTDRFIALLRHWEELQALAAVIRDRHFLEYILRTRLNLAFRSESKLLCTLLLAPEQLISNSDDPVRAAPSDPGSLRVTVGRLRRSLRSRGLDKHVSTRRANGHRFNVEYYLAPESRVQFFEAAVAPLMSTQLTLLFEDLVGPLIASQASLRSGRHSTESPWRRDAEGDIDALPMDV